MAMYNDTVIDHFMNPHNVGEIEDASGVGTFGSPVCGDMMQMSIKVDDKGVITDAKFKTYGCGSAIASSSIATDMIIGKTCEEALKVTNADVLKALGGLPSVKIHCSILSEQSISGAEAAVSDLKRQDCTRSDIRRKTTKGLSFQTTPFHSMEKNKWQIS